MRLSNETYEYIKNEVIDLFIRYDVKCAPVSGFELAIKMGIILIPYSSLSPRKLEKALFISRDGFYTELGDGKEYIYYNDVTDYKRSNMTILHEIGHAVLGHTEETEHEVKEAESGFFASYAAAPAPLIHKISNKSVLNISIVFDISFEAASHALDRYRKWLVYGPRYYTTYEKALVNQPSKRFRYRRGIQR